MSRRRADTERSVELSVWAEPDDGVLRRGAVLAGGTAEADQERDDRHSTDKNRCGETPSRMSRASQRNAPDDWPNERRIMLRTIVYPN